MASAQLQLIYTDHAWKLDRRTVEIGRAGIAQARAALAAAAASNPGVEPDPESGGHGRHHRAAA